MEYYAAYMFYTVCFLTFCFYFQTSLDLIRFSLHSKKSKFKNSTFDFSFFTLKLKFYILLFLFCFNSQIDQKASGSGYIFCVDFEDAKLCNVDFEMCKYIIYILKTFFPCGVAYILIVDLPWILRTFWGMVRSWIPSDNRDLIKMATRKDIHLFIDKNHLPDYLGGNCALPYKGEKVVPKNCPTLFEFASKKLKLNDQTCDRILSIYEPILEELKQRC